MSETIDRPALENSRLRGFVERLVNLETSKKEIAAHIKNVMEEAASAGFSKRAMRPVVKREMETEDERAEREQAEQDMDLMLAALHPSHDD